LRYTALVIYCSNTLSIVENYFFGNIEKLSILYFPISTFDACI